MNGGPRFLSLIPGSRPNPSPADHRKGLLFGEGLFCCPGYLSLFVFSGILLQAYLSSPAVCAPSSSDRLSEAEGFFWKGKGREALSIYKELIAEVTAEPAPTPASREILRRSLQGEIRIALRYGDHELAEQAVRLGLDGFPENSEMLACAARYAFYRGRLEEAGNLWEKAILADEDNLEARFRLLALEEQVSASPDQRQRYRWFLDWYAGHPGADPRRLEWVGRACVRLEKYEWDGAQKVYQKALDASPELEEILIAKGDLWLDRYDENAAIKIYSRILKKNQESLPAHLGIARANLAAGNLAGCKRALDQVLKLNPNHPVALAMLADLLFYDEQDETALRRLEKGLTTNPSCIPLYAVQAAYGIKRKSESTLARSRDRIRNVYGNGFEFQLRTAACLERNYLFREADEYYRKCLDSFPGNKRVLAARAILLSRISPASAETALEPMKRSFKEDPFHLRLYNMRNLFIRREKFSRAETEHFLVRFPPEAEKVYGTLALEALEKNFAEYCKKNPYRPKGKILVEFYSDPSDFSIRISGLPGAGLSGVCFGDMVILKAPGKGTTATFNWGNVLRHELVHVFSLGLSEARTPRWYTEGLSVSEEWDPGVHEDAMLAGLLEHGEVIPLEELDAAFHRPRGPAGIMLAYTISGEAVRWLTETFGISVHERLLKRFAEGWRTREALPAVTGLSLGELNRGVRRKIARRVGLSRTDLLTVPKEPDKQEEIGEPTEHEKRLEEVAEAVSKRDWDRVLALARKGLETSPDDLTFLEVLAVAAYKTGEKRTARKTAERILSVTESFHAQKVLAWLDRDYRRWDRAVENFLKAYRTRPRFVGPGSPIREAERILKKRRKKWRLCEILSERLSMEPTDSKAFCELAELSLEAGRYDIAEDAVRQALFLQPFDSEVQVLWGRVLAEKGELDKALDRFRVASELDPADGRPQLAMAWVYLRSGSEELAHRAAERALDLDPTLDEARDILSGSQVP